MAKTPAVTAVDPAADRKAVIDRVLARGPVPKVRHYLDENTGEQRISVTRVAGGSERTPPADLGEWCDDRVVACFGGRTGLNAGEQAAFEIVEACRTGDAAAVAAVARAAGRYLNALQAHQLFPVLEHWRGTAPPFALEVTSAALGEARRLGWDQRPTNKQLRQLAAAARAKAAA
jgi:hypothetical protein